MIISNKPITVFHASEQIVEYPQWNYEKDNDFRAFLEGV